VAFSHTTGDRLWEVDLVSAFGAKVPMWGYAESVLIDGDTLICTPGGSKVGIVALNKYTGEPVWKSPPLDTPASYASPIIVEFGGVRQVVNLVQSGLVAVEADSGRFLWRYGRPAPPNRPACSNALYANGCVFAASGYNIGGGLVKLGVEDDRVTATEVWDTKKMVNHHGGMVLVDGYIYGNHEGGWSCLEFETGEQQWYADGVGKGSVTYADGMLYCLSEKGTMGLVRATPEKCDPISTFTVPSGGDGPYWAHPVVCGGRLYVRHADVLHAYDIAAEE
jgi:outer membrane protein assembly factor BamB